MLTKVEIDCGVAQLAQPYIAFPKSVLRPDDGHLVQLLPVISSANAHRFDGIQASAYQVPRPAP